MNFKEIHIGALINQAVMETEIDIARICNFIKCSEKEILDMYESRSICTEILMRWSKLLEYDFFRIYTQHLILYSPPSGTGRSIDYDKNPRLSLPRFRKNIYTQEIIYFILERIQNGEMTKNEVIKKYNIPRTTLHKWISKYISA
ncbi:hypothetical protein HNP38_003021 [Chryseobacterium defluvii]|uniref:Uncharacterized protein n=1 Tax=Chryseobacterium defluvii TaxID=160396 RepID=A0A840KGB8_9FLAO|nr:transposase [Chryseobacterium defluvii]MBB4807705.1 hypothetical protein [Chryseobacterium defluvii]